MLQFLLTQIGKIKTAVSSLNSKISTSSGTPELPSGTTSVGFSVKKSGNVVTLNGAVTLANAIAGTNAVVLTLPADCKPSSKIDTYLWATYNNNPGMFHFHINTSGELVTDVGGNTVSNAILFPGVSFCV